MIKWNFATIENAKRFWEDFGVIMIFVFYLTFDCKLVIWFFFKLWNKFCGKFGGIILFAIYLVFVFVVKYE